MTNVKAQMPNECKISKSKIQISSKFYIIEKNFV